MRTLLIGVDGKTQESIYASELSSFGDVPMLLRSLLDTGLLEVVPEAQSSDAGQAQQPLGTANAGFSRSGASAFRNEPDGWFSSESSGRLDNAFRSPRVQAPIPTNINLSGWDALAQTLAPRDQPSSGSASLAPTVGQHQLREVISLMSDFVMMHLPEQSLAVVLVLEDIKSIEQAIASLQDYEALISPAGEPARRHLAELRKALAVP